LEICPEWRRAPEEGRKGSGVSGNEARERATTETETRTETEFSDSSVVGDASEVLYLWSLRKRADESICAVVRSAAGQRCEKRGGEGERDRGRELTSGSA
jgi:hypothetical protein